MDTQEGKIFSTIPPSKLSRGLHKVLIVVYCTALGHAFYKFIHPYVLDGAIPKIIEIMVLILIASPVISLIFPYKATKITVNAEAILLQKKNIKLNSIRIIRLLKQGGSDQLLIETDESKIMLGAELDKKK